VAVGGVLLVAVLAIGWIWSFTHARTLAAQGITPAGASITSALSHVDAPTAAYVTDAALDAFTRNLVEHGRGVSGKVRVSFQPPDVVTKVGGAIRQIADFNVIPMLPFSAKKNGRVGLYFIGNWPSEHGAVGPGKAPAGAYANPTGFIEVTPENKDARVSEHFKLGDFLTHDQPNVWPKYLVLQPKLVDKLELVLADLQAHGVDISGVTVMSGFRTPQYNYTGGNTGGRANLSRHMYGDASDIYIDSDHNGVMDDLNHDGRISIDDSRVVLGAVERVETAHPELVGGAGVYTAAPGHGPFIHIDTRGYRARWSGTSGG
jgi:uncharacterized protein YcbK (DUF882 family)